VTVFLIAFVVLVLFSTAFVLLFSRLFTRVDDNESAAEWLTDFSIETYRPMERLFNEADFQFLAEQPGYHPGIAKQLRAERKKIFRGYLRQLVGDFHRLVHVANLMMVYSGEDRSDLARSIFRLRVRFYWAVISTEVSLSLQPLVARPLQVGYLIAALTDMHQNIYQLAPMRNAA
jgi:hypothetical protein